MIRLRHGPQGPVITQHVTIGQTHLYGLRWEPPASAGGSDAPASRKESQFHESGFSPGFRWPVDNVRPGRHPQEIRTFFSSFATWEGRCRTPRLKPEENSRSA
jgi:hypothetical protein